MMAKKKYTDIRISVVSSMVKLQLSLLLSSSTGINIRTKRSRKSVTSRRQGCSLGTCTVHDLAHRLHELGNKFKIGSAPVDKISPQGYGRRRRSLPERTVTLRMEQGRLKPMWSITSSQVHKLEALLRRTWAGLCKRRWKQKWGIRAELGSSLLASKILQMPLTPAKYSTAHFLVTRTESEPNKLRWVPIKADLCNSAV